MTGRHAAILNKTDLGRFARFTFPGDETMKTNTATWAIEYSDHDTGAADGSMTYESKRDADCAAKRMRDYGYHKTVVVRQLA